MRRRRAIRASICKHIIDSESPANVCSLSAQIVEVLLLSTDARLVKVAHLLGVGNCVDEVVASSARTDVKIPTTGQGKDGLLEACVGDVDVARLEVADDVGERNRVLVTNATQREEF
jgi:hypothetical protein